MEIVAFEKAEEIFNDSHFKHLQLSFSNNIRRVFMMCEQCKEQLEDKCIKTELW